MTTSTMTALRRPGWLTFAAIVMISVGILRIIAAISYFGDSSKVNDLSGGVFGDQLFLWGIFDLIIAAFALWGGYALLSGDMFGRVLGYIWAGVVLIQSFLILRFAPWFGFAAIALATLVMYALSVTSEWRDERRDEI
jgi:hypothetical protein